MVKEPQFLDLRQTTVLITGATGGIGRGIARQFAAAGAHLVLHHRSSPQQARALVDQIERDGGRATSAQGDIHDPQQCSAIVTAATEEFGQLDALVNNAGIQPINGLQNMTADQWRAVVDVNLTGTFTMTQAAVAAMTGGSITHIASVEGSLPARGHAHYASAKAAVIMHARAAALELGPRGFRVNTVSPGLIDTGELARDWPQGRDAWKNAAPLGRTGTPEDIGDACVFLASPLARWISGHNLVVDGGMSSVPAW